MTAHRQGPPFNEVAQGYDRGAARHRAQAAELRQRATQADQDGEPAAAAELREDAARQTDHARNEEAKAERLRGTEDGIAAMQNS